MSPDRAGKTLKRRIFPACTSCVYDCEEGEKEYLSAATMVECGVAAVDLLLSARNRARRDFKGYKSGEQAGKEQQKSTRANHSNN